VTCPVKKVQVKKRNSLRILLPVLGLLCISHHLPAQDIGLRMKSDSLKNKLAADSARIFKFKKLRLVFSFDNRSSFVRSIPVDFNGVQLGFIYRERHSFGVGFYGMTVNSQQPVKVKDANRTINQTLRLNFTMVFYEFVLVSRRYFSLHLPIEAGFGNYNVVLQDSLSKKIVRDDRAPVLPLGTGLQVIIKPFRWVGLSLLGGYRYVSEKSVNLNFNGVFYSVGVWFDVRQAYREWKYWKVKRTYRREMAK
jgi:hypothetical protein